MFGIIIEVKIKTKEIISNNLLLETKILKSIKEVDKELKKKDEYKYIQIDPFFRKNFEIHFFEIPLSVRSIWFSIFLSK